MYTLVQAHEALSQKKLTATELARSVLKEAEKHKDLNNYIELFDDVLEQAKLADARIEKGDIQTLTGIPLAIKDNILIEGRKASAGSKILESYTASYDATVIEKLKKQGAVFLGRTNMDEFAMGSSTEHSAFGVTLNPHDPTRVPGGSSGGSAVSVAIGAAVAALGSDTGGSIRQPASFCGVVGLKPTYGAVSRSGLIAMGSSLDQIGPLTQTVSDAKLLFDAIAGHDSKDSTSLSAVKFVPAPKKIKIGVPRHFMEEGLEEDVRIKFEEALEKLKGAGHNIVEVELPLVKYALAIYYIIMPAEASTNLARFDGVRYGLHKEGIDVTSEYIGTRTSGFGAEVKRRIMLGTYVLSTGYADSYYRNAEVLRREITNDFNKVFSGSTNRVDAIATPTSPTPAFKIGEKSDPLSMYLTDIFTTPANLTGMPALSIPMGAVEREGNELPVGFQVMAPYLHENTLFALGQIIENKK